MRKQSMLLVVCVLAVASVASATLNVPDGLTGLWRFEDGANNTAATFGTDMVAGSAGANGFATFSGPWTSVGIEGFGEEYADGSVLQMSEWGYLQTFHGIAPNGGGALVNEYTVAMDYVQTSDLGQWNSLFQTSANAHGSDGDLWVTPTGQVGVGSAGYSTLTLDPSTWHRIVLSVDNANFYRVYVDGELFLDGAAQGVDGRFSLSDNFHLLADDSWGELGWGLLGTVATWDHALTTAEIAGMGGWIDGASSPTPLVLTPVVPEPATMVLLGLGSLVAIRRRK